MSSKAKIVTKAVVFSVISVGAVFGVRFLIGKGIYAAPMIFLAIVILYGIGLAMFLSNSNPRGRR